MNEVVTSLSPLENCFEKNPHFAHKKWLYDFRSKQFNQFLARGLPTKKEEDWKYTEIKNTLIPTKLGVQTEIVNAKIFASIDHITDVILTFVNGNYVEALSHTASLAKEINVCSLAHALDANEDRVKPFLTRDFDGKRFPFAKLNAALMTNGVFIEIPKNVKISKPIYLLFINTEQQHYLTCPRNVLIANAGSEVTFIEHHVSETAKQYFTNVVSDITVGNNARVDYYKLQEEHHTATHVANVFVTQNQDSCVKTYFLSQGAHLSREDLTVWQHAPNVESYLQGLYYTHHDHQHIDHHVHVDHAYARGKSSMMYKGILNQKSKAIFKGKVYVHPSAQHIEAHQANHNLLLSADAEINTQPALEIYADDVKCTHGATIGQFDHDALFYLRARGVASNEAYRMLTHAFADEFYNKMDNPAIKQYLRERMICHDE